MTACKQRALRPWRSWALVVAGTIGSAVFMMPTILVPFVGLGLLSLAGVRVTCRFDARQPLAAGDDHRWPLRHARAGFRDCGGLLIACGYWISLDSL